MAFSQRFIEVDGCRINLRRGGSGEPLLYLHGSGGAPAVLPFMEKLAERFDVLVPEHPGFGASDEPEWLENMHDPFLRKWLHRVDVPVKIVWGEADKILPVAYAGEFKRLMPGAEVDIIPRCGHLPQAERPEEFCDIVVRFAGKG